MTFWCSLPGGVAWLVCLLVLEESSRFELISRHKDTAFEILEKMIKWNKSDLVLDEEIKHKLSNWANVMNKMAKHHSNGSIVSLFEGEKLRTTCLIWFNWFTLSFMYYGIVLLLPYTLQNIDEGNNFVAQDKLL